MKSVLISIPPKWCELIANGNKTIEVRKNKPKLDTPFKCLIYCTQGKPYFYGDGKSYISDTLNLLKTSKEQFAETSGLYMWNSKVIGEFVCDEIEKFEIPYQAYFPQTNTQIVNNTCLTCQQIKEYANGKQSVYGWHISNLKIYETPKELGEFKNSKNEIITRAFQSWGYVND